MTKLRTYIELIKSKTQNLIFTREDLCDWILEIEDIQYQSAYKKSFRLLDSILPVILIEKNIYLLIEPKIRTEDAIKMIKNKMENIN